MILTFSALSGSNVSLDVSNQFGDSVELCCFQFVEPPIEFRLIRRGLPLQEWQAGNTEMYDLQHGPGIKEWCRDGHWFINDLDHRNDLMTCGVLAKELIMETRGLGLPFVLSVWPREGTWRAQLKK